MQSGGYNLELLANLLEETAEFGTYLNLNLTSQSLATASAETRNALIYDSHPLSRLSRSIRETLQHVIATPRNSATRNAADEQFATADINERITQVNTALVSETEYEESNSEYIEQPERRWPEVTEMQNEANDYAVVNVTEGLNMVVLESAGSGLEPRQGMISTDVQLIIITNIKR